MRPSARRRTAQKAPENRVTVPNGENQKPAHSGIETGLRTLQESGCSVIAIGGREFQAIAPSFWK
jgi:hypothetical protein